MPRPDPEVIEDLLSKVGTAASDYLEGLDERPVGPPADAEHLRTVLGGSLPEHGEPPATVFDRYLEAASAGTVATGSARYFGFVIGGALPAPLALDMLTPVWDQNVGLFIAGPAASVAEEVARRWLVELFGLPAASSVGFVTGGQMANTTALAIARHHVLASEGWNVEKDGLQGAPPISVVVGEERHSTIDRALRFIGLGSSPITVAVDSNGAMIPAALEAAVSPLDGPTIVCAQVGNVNTGALDPVGAIADVAQRSGAWLHVDGAFGLWARCLDRFDGALDGLERADSWSVDAHKWLNVPYDSGLVFCAHPTSHRNAIGVSADSAPYLSFDGATRDAVDWNPEFSRRARGPAVWAALRSLGRRGVVALVERCCALASEFAEVLSREPGIEIRNEVVLNQVLVAFADADADEVIRTVQNDGTCWMGGTTWRGERLMRISVSNWQTDSDDIRRSAAAVVRSHRQVAASST